MVHTEIRLPWRDYFRESVTGFGAMREGIVLAEMREHTGSIITRPESEYSRNFGASVGRNLESAVIQSNLGVVILDPTAVCLNPSACTSVSVKVSIERERTVLEKSFDDIVGVMSHIVLGLVREDGFVSPLAFSIGLVLFQNSQPMPYDEKTDFRSNFQALLHSETAFL